MKIKRGWILFIFVVVLAIVLFNLKLLGWVVSNETTSNITISAANSNPIIWNLTNPLFACEGEQLFSIFYANDSDGDALTGSIVPQNPFFVFWLSQTSPNTHQFAVVSGTLDKNDLDSVNSGYKLYEETVYVDDNYNSTCCTDSENVNITVIEINNAPDIEDIGVKTIWTQGENSTFYEVWSINDVEYGWGYGSLIFNISILNSTGSSVNLFNISSQGIMNFTANSTTPLGVYNITVCVEDTGLTTPHTNISDECGQTGGNISRCDNFSLTITDENRAPTITDYYPSDLTLSVPGTQQLDFNITTNDPDGTIPDAYWYVNDILIEYDSGSSVDEFSYNFGCGISGNATIKVDITDGLLNDSLQWNVTYSAVACVETPSGGGGGAGAGISSARFEISPLFITTTLFEEEAKTFEVNITNTGNEALNINTSIENISNMAILSEDNFVLGFGESKTLQLYLYALHRVKPGVYFGKIWFDSGNLQKKIDVVIEVREKEPLFDLKVRVPSEYKSVNAGDNLKVIADMLNVGMYGTAVDVELHLYITDFNRLILYEASKEMIAVETNLSVERMLHVPFGTSTGTYLVLGEMKYTNITITTYDTFNVVEKKYLRVSYILIILAVLALIFFIFFLLYKRRKKKKEEEE